MTQKEKIAKLEATLEALATRVALLETSRMLSMLPPIGQPPYTPHSLPMVAQSRGHYVTNTWSAAS